MKGDCNICSSVGYTQHEFVFNLLYHVKVFPQISHTNERSRVCMYLSLICSPWLHFYNRSHTFFVKNRMKLKLKPKHMLHISPLSARPPEVKNFTAETTLLRTSCQ